MSKPADMLRELVAEARTLVFPPGFTLGAATAAYQIEGAIREGGKGESIWDRFTQRPGVIRDGTSGDPATDHHRRWPEDFALLKAMNLTAYRFSLAWTRLQPNGAGRFLGPGVSFYSRLIDALLEAGIAPFVTLYHWDLPQALQDRGGWYNRDTAYRFAEYAERAASAFSDRVTQWTTLNEPWTFCWSGHAEAEDAPGLKDGVRGGLLASHHALLGHGLAVPAIRSAQPAAQVGLVLDLNVAEPATDRREDIAAAGRFDGAQNRWFLDAVFKGHYPQDILERCHAELPPIREGDDAIIAAPIDYLGINIYRRSVIAAGPTLPPLDFRRVQPPGRYSATDYEIHPRCMYDILRYVHERYSPATIYVTENGLALGGETVTAEGRVHDHERARYLIDHLGELIRAAQTGVPVKGYFAWTLTDNFEWAMGYTTPFGLATIDRQIKDSGLVYGEIAGLIR